MTRGPVYPFVAVVGQNDVKAALIANAVDPKIGGVMIMGRRGTAKSTAVRGLADLLPPIETIENCPIRCEPGNAAGFCAACKGGTPERISTVRTPIVDLPLGATEDRVVGTLDLEAALVRGEKSFEPGLIGRAHRGFLYVDEVNLLDDHLVDLLLDVAASGENVVERESMSVRHPAQFVLIGSGNPEEGELRPQLLDRFGLYVTVTTEDDRERRAEIVRRRLAFEDDPTLFAARFADATQTLRQDIADARKRLPAVVVPDSAVSAAGELCRMLDVDGHRGEITLIRAARVYAALRKSDSIATADLAEVAKSALRHRLHRDPLETRDLEHRLSDAIQSVLGSSG